MKAGFITKRIPISILFLAVILLPSVSEATDVGGIIDTDTVWNLAGSPYNITSRISIATGITLTIQPGVIVNRGPYPDTEITLLGGTLKAIGTSDSRIILNNLYVSNRYGDNSTIDIRFAELNTPYLYLRGGNSFTLLNSNIYAGSSDVAEITPLSNDSYIERNVIIGDGTGSGFVEAVNFGTGQLYIRNNVFYNQNNNPANAPFAIFCNSSAIVEYNSFLSIDTVAIRLASTGDLMASNNFWNTDKENIIDSMIWDRNDSLAVGYVIYTPILTAPHPDTPIPSFNQPPIAVCGVDQAVHDVVTLDGSGSSDPDGSIVSYDWKLQYRGDQSYDRYATGKNPTITNLHAGWYDAHLIVTDDLGAKKTCSSVVAAAGPCEGWPQPNGDLTIGSFKIVENKRSGVTTTTMSGVVTLPELLLGSTVQARITIELFDALAGGRDCVLSEEKTLSVSDRPKSLTIGQ